MADRPVATVSGLLYALDDVPPGRQQQVVATPGDRNVTLSWRANEEPGSAS